MRLTRDEYYMAIATATAARSTCPRRQVGAVLIKDGRILATGYNGAPRGFPHCLDVGCEQDVHGSCKRTVHAEVNAVLLAGRCDGATLYCTASPCRGCADVLINARIARLVYQDVYDPNIIGRVVQGGIDVYNLAARQLESGFSAHPPVHAYEQPNNIHTDSPACQCWMCARRTRA